MIKEFVEYLNNNESVNIVFFGDSVTHGYFESHEKMHGTTDYEAVYHNRLRKMIKYFYPEKTVNIVNSGVGGESAKMALQRMEKGIFSHNPNLVVVCFGLNDINSDDERVYLEPLEEMFKAMKAKNIPTIFMTPNMLNTKPVLGFLNKYSKTTSEYQNGGKMDKYINNAIEVAKNNDTYVCDCYKKWRTLYKNGVDIDSLLANGVNHPKREMHNLFAICLFDLIFG